METILVLERLCRWRSFSRLLPTGAATVVALAGSLGIARGAPVVGCPSSPLTFAMAQGLYLPASTPCEVEISDFLLDSNSEGEFAFAFFSDAGPIATTLFYANNAPIFGRVNGVPTVVGREAAFCYSAYAVKCPELDAPLSNNLGSSLGLVPPFEISDYVPPPGFSAYGELTFYLSGTVGGQSATLGLAIYDVRNELSFASGALIALPEPSTYGTVGIGVLAMVVFRRKIGRTVL